jgi:hypothetical protein
MPPADFIPSSEPSPTTRHRLTAEQVIRHLKHFQGYEIQASRLLGGWMPGIARWETKHEIGLHLWQDAQHSRDLRTRLWELRVTNPDRGLEQTLASTTRALASAQEDDEFLAGLYWVLKTELAAAYQAVVNGTSEVYDGPTIAVIKRILPDKMAQLDWAKREIAAMLDTGEKQRRSARWMDYCRMVLRKAGGVTGEAPDPLLAEPVPPPGYTLKLPFPQALRDDRFKMVLKGMDLPPADDRDAKLIFQFFNYSQEMQAAETLGSLLWETEGMEWEFYFDLARHCYDEVRHSSMGEARLRELGHHVTDFPNFSANYAWRQLVDPLRRYCVLTYVIEADGFKYKHETYQEHLRNQDLESAEAVLYDIMDETMHVRFGQKWVPRLMERYHYEQPLEKLISECREILMANSVSPLQKLVSHSVQRPAPQDVGA